MKQEDKNQHRFELKLHGVVDGKKYFSIATFKKPNCDCGVNWEGYQHYILHEDGKIERISYMDSTLSTMHTSIHKTDGTLKGNTSWKITPMESAQLYLELRKNEIEIPVFGLISTLHDLKCVADSISHISLLGVKELI